MSSQLEHLVLVAIEGPDKDQVFFLERFPARIGREEGNQVRLSDPSVSRYHGQIQIQEGELWLTVLKKDAAPVTVDGRRFGYMETARLMPDQSVIVLGSTKLLLLDKARLEDEAQKKAQIEGTISDLIPKSDLFRSEIQALMMADVCDSTGKAYDKAQAQGSAAADKALAKAFDTFYNIFDRHANSRNVIYVEKPGDAVFATFRTALDCCVVACKVLFDLERIRSRLVERDILELNVRVALHYAPITFSTVKAHFFGLPINLTSRLQSLTAEQAVNELVGELPPANRILMTTEMRDALPESWQRHTWAVGSFGLKGFRDQAFPVYGLNWKQIIQDKLVG